MAHRTLRTAASGLAILALSACGGRTPPNLEPVSRGDAYQAQYRNFAGLADAQPILASPRMNAEKCLPHAGDAGRSGDAGKLGRSLPQALRGELLSRGDLLDLRLPGDDLFSGEFVVSRDGTLKLPYLAPIPAQGRSTAQVAADIRRGLMQDGYYDDAPDVSLLLMDFSAVRVAVNGAVFEPRPVDIGGASGDRVNVREQAAMGASTEGRNLSAALRNAGGVRPDADLSAVRITRGGTNYIVDLRGAVNGAPFQDVMLLTGDEVFVPSRQCFQDDLMKPSPISPPGISLYLSNLTQPAAGNAVSAIGQSVREVPYGTRYIQAVIDANCVGGARATSADRSAALFSRNPVTKVSAVIERPIEKLRKRADRDDYDPYLLPGDAIACYDSGLTNIGELGKIFGLFGAISLLN